MTPPPVVTVLHVAAGTLVLGVAPAAMLVRKGGLAHRRWGTAFACAMIVVLLTATVMWQPHGHLFLLFLDVVSAYLVFQGYRVIARRRRKQPDAREDAIDLGAALLVLASTVALLVLAATAATPLMRSIALILAAIAAIAAAFAALDLRAIRAGAQSRLGSLLVHISAMIGAYISAVTAFLVINLHTVPMAVRWIVPSLVGTFVIGGFSTVYRRRFAKARRARPARSEAVRPVSDQAESALPVSGQSEVAPSLSAAGIVPMPTPNRLESSLPK
jgi:general stress protein CsbA